MRATRGRLGTSLLELLITLTLLALMSAVVVMAVRRIDAPAPTQPAAMIQDSLRRAVAEGRSVTVRALIDNVSVSATANPDGSVIADSMFHVDRLTGRAGHER
jgi:hypothetical protein